MTKHFPMRRDSANDLAHNVYDGVKTVGQIRDDGGGRFHAYKGCGRKERHLGDYDRLDQAYQALISEL